MPTLTDQAAELEAKAAELRTKADAEEAERRRQYDELNARREPLVHQWWTDRQRTFSGRVRGRVDAAWKAFTTAVTDGGDTIAAWRDYRTAVAVVQDERRAIREWLHDLELARVEALTRRIVEAHSEGVNLASRESGHISLIANGVSREEYDRRLAAYNAAASELLGKKLAPDAEPRPWELPDLPQRPPSLGRTVEPRDPHGAETYSQAVDLVVSSLARQATLGADQVRGAEMEQWVQEQLAEDQR